MNTWKHNMWKNISELPSRKQCPIFLGGCYNANWKYYSAQHVARWMDGCMDGWMDGWVGGWMDGWIAR